MPRPSGRSAGVWRNIGGGCGSWGRWKFNRVLLSFKPWQPFVHFEYKGHKKSTAVLRYGKRFPVDGDTAGRGAFGGAKEFENPDFVGKTTYEEKTKAGITLARGIIDSAHDLGMSAALAFSPFQFPAEFAGAFPGIPDEEGVAKTVRRKTTAYPFIPKELPPPDAADFNGLVG